jgi:Tfp pilus assembly protein PilV
MAAVGVRLILNMFGFTSELASLKSLKNMQGMSLIEVLVAFGVLCIVLLGVIKISLSNIRIESVALDQSIASMRVSAVLERLRVNWQPQAAQETINQWNQLNLQMLPLGHGDVHCNTLTQQCTVQITWDSNGRQAYAITAKTPHPVSLSPPNHFSSDGE